MPFFIRPSRGSEPPASHEIDSVWHDLLDAVPAMIWLSDLHGCLLHSNAAWTEATGLSVADYDRGTAWTLVHPDDHGRLVEAAARFAGQPVSFEYRMRKPDGTHRWVLEHIRPWCNKAGVQLGYIGSAIDIQDKKEHEQRLALTALRQTSLSHFSRVAMERVLPETVHNEALRLLCEHFQLPAALLILQQAEGVPAGVVAHTGLSPASLPPLQNATAGTGATLEYPEDASVFPIATAWLVEHNWREAVAVPVDPEKPEIGWLVGLRSVREGSPIGPVHYARDLATLLALSHAADRAQHKLIEGEARALQAHKMESVGLLAGGVAHDFNNLLTAIRCFAELLRDDLTDANQRGRVDDILHASSRASHLVRQLLAFSRHEVSQCEPLDLNMLLDELRGFIRSLLSEHVRIEVDLYPAPAWCSVDRKQLEQVLFNLCLNARDAMVTDGTLSLRVTVDAQNRRVRLSVGDTGTGIPPEVREKLFQPFYTTKARGRGTGLGLATSLVIARSFGGNLTFETELGKGTVFHLDLPEIADPLAALDEAPAASVEQRPARVMLVEDDELVRTVTRMMAESIGHEVVGFADSCEAFAWATAEQLARIDLLVTDIVMPGMNGHQLASRLREIKPDLRVLYMSGYVDDESAMKAMAQPDVFFLAKPFSSEEFAGKLAACLASS